MLDPRFWPLFSSFSVAGKTCFSSPIAHFVFLEFLARMMTMPSRVRHHHCAVQLSAAPLVAEVFFVSYHIVHTAFKGTSRYANLWIS